MIWQDWVLELTFENFTSHTRSISWPTMLNSHQTLDTQKYGGHQGVIPLVSVMDLVRDITRPRMQAAHLIL